MVGAEGEGVKCPGLLDVEVRELACGGGGELHRQVSVLGQVQRLVGGGGWGGVRHQCVCVCGGREGGWGE
jgi:hypothetical protein